MASGQRLVTGDKELDAMLKALPITLQKKHMRKATRTVAKTVKAEIRSRVPTDTKAMRDSFSVRSIPRSRNKVGASVRIDREKVTNLREARNGRVGYDAKRGEAFFYPASVEFEDQHGKPIRASLYSNANHLRSEAIKEVKKLIREAEAAAKL